MTGKRFSFFRHLSRPFLRVHPLWALLEMWLLGLLLLFVLSGVAGAIPRAALANGTLMMCGLCGMWAVLRARLPRHAWWQQVAWELAMGAAVSLIMVLGLGVPARWLGWDAVWMESTMGSSVAGLVRAMTGLGYLAARVGVRLWLFWNRLRRRRMLWALTHAHLTTAFWVMMGVLVLFVTVPIFFGERTDPESLSPVASFTTLLLHTLFPAVSVVLVFTLFVLALVMPPSAILSFFAARKTTRRLENLTRAAQAWRSGDYAARAEISGEDEVAQLQADLNVMAESLQATLRELQTERDTVTRLLLSRRELIASVSHELRTPVATMRAMLESMLLHWPDEHEQEAPPPTLQHELDVMYHEIQRLQTLIDDLFTLSQAEVEHLTLHCEPADVVPIVRQMVDAVAPLAWQSGRVQVIAELPAGLPRACVDGTRLEQILANLLRNAIRHTPPGGIVAVMAQAEPDFVRVEVRDTGEGIDEQDLPRIWERFYRGSKGEPDKGSAGLGLALVKELTEAMGGRVGVTSQVGEGSCFTVRLPRV